MALVACESRSFLALARAFDLTLELVQEPDFGVSGHILRTGLEGRRGSTGYQGNVTTRSTRKLLI
jgi:hypothetical protein